MGLADLETQLAGERSRLGDKRGLIFDIGMLAANALLVPFLRARFYAWVWTGVLAYTVGALIKARPLRHRLALAGAQPWTTAPVRLVYGLIMLWTLQAAFLAEGGMLIGVALAIAAVPAGLTMVAISPRKTGRLPGRHVEWLADALILYCAIFFSLLADQTLSTLQVGANDPFWVRPVLVVALSPLFFMTYAPVRILFLVEDGNNRATWLRMLLVGLPLFRRVLIP